MRELTFSGRVEKGEGNSKRLGCPTANITIEQGAIIPALGVYVGQAEIDGTQYTSLVYINDGRTGNTLKIEVHLLNQQSDDLTGKHINVVLYEKIRENILFPGDEEIMKMIEKDMQKATKWFGVHQS